MLKRTAAAIHGREKKKAKYKKRKYKKRKYSLKTNTEIKAGN
jgi:hypothetical protein